jgi:hypothetical protein
LSSNNCLRSLKRAVPLNGFDVFHGVGSMFIER